VSVDSEKTTVRRSYWPLWLAAFAFALPVLYLSSIGPVWRLAQPTRKGGVQRFYGPAFTLMERTPLRTPLLAWCAAWGVREKIEREIERREVDRTFDILLESSR